MAVIFSEMCAVRTDLALKIEAAFKNYLDDIAQGYGAYLTPVLEEGETAPDVKLMLELLGRKVKQHRQRIDSLDEEVLEEAHGDDKVRAELDQRITAVDAKLRLVRSAYRGFYGRANLGRVGLDREFQRGAVRLHREAVVVKASLISPDFNLQPLLEIELTDREGKPKSMAAQLAGQLDPELSRLSELLDERHHERSKTTDARLQRQEVIREFDFNIRGIVRMAQGMFRLAGRSDLATRIRPILRRVLRKLDDQKAQENAGAENDAEVEATPEGGETEPQQTGEAAAPEAATA